METAGFLRPSAALVRWGPATERRQNAGPPGFQVHRGKFDDILLHHARQAGALVLQPAQLLELQKNDSEAEGWRMRVRHAAGPSTMTARFVVDATGRAGWLGGRRISSGPRMLALYAYWKEIWVGPETRIEAGHDKWFWGAPLPAGEFNATVFIDSRRYGDALSRAGNVEILYRNLLANSSLLACCLQGKPATAVRVCDASSFQHETPVTQHAIRVGEASFSIDPLSSQGVQSAMGSALHAAAVLHTVLKYPERAELAFEFYRTRQAESVALHANAAARFYAEAAKFRSGEFWQKRAASKVLESSRIEAEEMWNPNLQTDKFQPGPQTKIHLAPTAPIRTIPMLRNDLIVPAEAFVLPHSHRPIAVLGGVEVSALLQLIRSSATAAQLFTSLSEHVPQEQTMAILAWLWNTGVLISPQVLQPEQL